MQTEDEMVDQTEGAVDWGAEVEDDFSSDAPSSEGFEADVTEEEDAPAAKSDAPAEESEVPPAEEEESKGAEPAPEETPKEKPEEKPEDKEEPEASKSEEDKPAEEKKGEAPSEEESKEQKPLNLKELEEKALGELEQFYALSEEEKQLLETEPEAAMPKIAAKMHWRTFNSVMHAVSSMLPQAISAHGQISTHYKTLEDKFFGAHPELREVDQNVVVQNIRAYRAANPKADPDTVIQGAGVLTKMQLKIMPKAEPQQPERKPHQPAVPGAKTQATPQDENTNPWATEFEEDIDE